MKVEHKISVIAGIIALLITVGCSDNNTIATTAPRDDLPPLLTLMQGSWSPVSTNGCTGNCGITIEGYSIRLRYQESPDSSMERQSSLIERIDDKNQNLIINGGVGIWPFFYGKEDGAEHLEIEFFSQQHGVWKRMHMQRSSS
jgi:hypothetical protein